MILLEHAVARLRQFVERRDTDGAIALFFQVIQERTEAMNLRAQQAESRACKAERNLDRLVRAALPDPHKEKT